MDITATFPIIIELPLRLDEGGAIRVGNTRVLLDTIIIAFNMGTSPETIAQQFDAVSLTQVYQVIGYYLDNRETVDNYLAKRQSDAEILLREWEAKYPRPTKEELLQRYEERTGKKYNP